MTKFEFRMLDSDIFIAQQIETRHTNLARWPLKLIIEFSCSHINEAANKDGCGQ